MAFATSGQGAPSVLRLYLKKKLLAAVFALDQGRALAAN